MGETLLEKPLWNMTFSQEPYERVKIEHLFDAHAKDASWGTLPVNFNSAALEYYQTLGGVRCYIARVDNLVVGYNVFMVSPDMFRKDMTAATEVAIYLDPLYRGAYGLKFIQWVDSRIECDILYRGSGPRRDLSPLYKREGFELVGTVWGKFK